MASVYLPPRPTTALTCVLRCFPCEPTWAGSPFLHRPPTRPMVTMTRSKTFQAYLPSCHRTYSCIHCRAHLANHDELISKSFQGSQGRAYLFNSVVNVGCGPAEERVLLTGLHAVADIYCENCKTTLGWKYSSDDLPLLQNAIHLVSPFPQHDDSTKQGSYYIANNVSVSQRAGCQATTFPVIRHI
ncbi:uncharacterized protein ypel2b isoform X2 [Megalobrama amblycephala]|uniref:uncharacterized protein ypel2b isoform X2 n=1 Tax=Megalobrama amblycephala TaxID=75352 RepID=UPI00201476AD|nr:uncharacterized protein ypel2b isoform X2 [Megalobrama amblycephala]